jgi:hypothetical protein
MYEDFEVRTSYKYLQEVITVLNEPICMLGGWAVFFQVNEKFEMAQGRPYLGSKDIDLGFHLKEGISNIDLKNSALAHTISILTKRLKFKHLSFRLFKEIHTETEEEIQDGQFLPAHFIFPVFVDIIVDSIPKNFKEIMGFNPIDEPLLRRVFEGMENQIEIKGFRKRMLLPTPELLLAMKVNSLPNRDKEHKKVKDICDIFALLWYTGIKPDEAKKSVLKFTTKANIRKYARCVTKEDIQKASTQINHSTDEIKRVLGLLQ